MPRDNSFTGAFRKWPRWGPWGQFLADRDILFIPGDICSRGHLNTSAALPNMGLMEEFRWKYERKFLFQWKKRTTACLVPNFKKELINPLGQLFGPCFIARSRVKNITHGTMQQGYLKTRQENNVPRAHHIIPTEQYIIPRAGATSLFSEYASYNGHWVALSGPCVTLTLIEASNWNMSPPTKSISLPTKCYPWG